MTRRTSPQHRESKEQIDYAIAKLHRRIQELKSVNVLGIALQDSGEDAIVTGNVRESVRDAFGQDSQEFQEYGNFQLVSAKDKNDTTKIYDGIRKGVFLLERLIDRLKERREELTVTVPPTSEPWFDDPNLHPRINKATTKLFVDGHHWEAVFAASKLLVNYVKERSGQYHLDGAHLMRTVFSPKNPILAFNDLSDQTDLDEQEGMMHLFEGVVLGIRNPGGHSFPEGTEQRAAEYISLISLLMYRVEETRNTRATP